MSKSKFLFLALLFTLISGCANTRTDVIALNRTTNNQNLPALKVPEGTQLAFQTLYKIPPRNYPTDIQQVDITPPQLYT